MCCEDGKRDEIAVFEVSECSKSAFAEWGQAFVRLSCCQRPWVATRTGAKLYAYLAQRSNDSNMAQLAESPSPKAETPSRSVVKYKHDHHTELFDNVLRQDQSRPQSVSSRRAVFWSSLPSSPKSPNPPRRFLYLPKSREVTNRLYGDYLRRKERAEARMLLAGVPWDQSKMDEMSSCTTPSTSASSRFLELIEANAMHEYGAVRWFITLFKDPDVLALRTEPMELKPPDYAIVTDASPQGMGAILATIDHNVGQNFTILEALEIPVLEQDAKWLGVEWNQSSSQGPLEAWAVKLAFKRWSAQLEGKSVVLRSDSVVALAMAKRLSSPSPVINWVGAELAIRCDKHGIKRVITQHIPGKWNAEADWLSRPHERSPTKPERLDKVPIKSFPRNMMHKGYLNPPGVAPLLWGSSASQVSGAFELLRRDGVKRRHHSRLEGGPDRDEENDCSFIRGG
eukprot:g20412.t1